MERWSFELLGAVSARSESRRLDDLMGKKPGAVLALLALSPGRPRSREEIVDLIWPEVDLDDARNRFRLVLHGLRKLLEPPGVEPGSVLFADRTQVGIAAGHASDVAEFQKALRSAAVATEPAQQAQNLRAALALYRGEFAPGFYLDVLLTERQRLAALAEGAQQKLALLEEVSSLRPMAMPALDIPLIPPFVPAKDRFFGRKDEQEHLKKLIERNRLVTILGPGGIGKTRLALKMTQTVTSGETARFVPLATLQNGVSIPDILVATLNLPPSSEPALARLNAAFAGEETLLALDNIEHLLDSGGVEAISSLLETLPNVRLLATSRVRTNLPQECLYPLGSLSEEEAVALFVDRAQLTRFDFSLTEENAPAVRELCRRLDGLPLAIELAAARIAVLTPAQILERLSRRFDLLTDKRKDREERHRSLRAALDWGWGLLSPEVQRFFAQLSLFRGSFSLEAVEAITGEPLAIDYLQNLLEASFLLAEADPHAGAERRFYLLETLREYGLEKLEKEYYSEKQFTINEFCNFFFKKALFFRKKIKEDGVSGVVRLFKNECDNFSISIEYSLGYDPLLASDFCITLNIFWDECFMVQQTVGYIETALEKLQEMKDIDRVRVEKLHSALGLSYYHIQQPEKGYKHSSKSLEYSRALLELAEAEGVAEEKRMLRRRSLAASLHNVAMHISEPSIEKENLYKEAAALNRQIVNYSWLGLNLGGLCYIYAHRALRTAKSVERSRFLRLALEYAKEAIDYSRSLVNDMYLSNSINNLSSSMYGLGDKIGAMKYNDENFMLSCGENRWHMVACSVLKYHCFALESGNWEMATQFLGGAEGLAQQWNFSLSDDKTTCFYGILQPLRDALPQALGQERYEALYQEGFHATIDTIKQWAAAIRLDPAQ